MTIVGCFLLLDTISHLVTKYATASGNVVLIENNDRRFFFA